MIQKADALTVRALTKSVPGGRRLFAGLDESDAGEVSIEGMALGALDEARRTRLRRERIGFVFQAFHILPYLTLRQNVALPLALVSANAAE